MKSNLNRFESLREMNKSELSNVIGGISEDAGISVTVSYANLADAKKQYKDKDSDADESVEKAL